MKRKALTFPGPDSASETIFAKHLETEGAFVHKRNDHEFVIVFRHSPSGEMALLLEDDFCELLPDW